MSTPVFELSMVTQACRDLDLQLLSSVEDLLGVRIEGPVCEALVANVDDPAGEQPYIRSSFPLDKALLVVIEAARSPLGIAAWEHNLRWGRQVAIAYRKDGVVCFSAGVLPNTRLPIGDVWRELSPWYKDLKKNRKRLAIWAEREELVRIPTVALSDQSEPSDENERAAFLAKIIAQPHDRGLRSVFADWLLERNDIQGTMIQLGERWLDARATNDPLAQDLRAQVQTLVTEHGDRLAGDLARRADSYELEAGFVRAIRMKASTFATHGDRLLQEHPIQTLTVTTVTDKGLRKLPGAKGLLRLRHLVLEQGYGRQRPVDLGPFCDSPHLGFLQKLTLDNCPLAGAPAAAFRRIQAPNLRTLELSMFSDAHQVLEGLTDNPVVKLETLTLGRFRDAPPWSSALTGPTFANLVSLDLSGVDAVGTARLLVGTQLSKLRAVSLRHAVPFDWPQLESFRFDHGSKPTEEAVATVLVRCPMLKQLEVMGLKGIDRAGCERLVDQLLALPADRPLKGVRLYRLDQDLRERLQSRFTKY